MLLRQQQTRTPDKLNLTYSTSDVSDGLIWRRLTKEIHPVEADWAPPRPRFPFLFVSGDFAIG
jgi:hypothetical protein